MNTRIKRFMDHKGISSSELADTIGVQRSNVTHVLQGRNKPSFQFISKLLETYPEISAKWLIMGGENMLEHGKVSQQELFPEHEKTEEKARPVDKEHAPYVKPPIPQVPLEMVSGSSAPPSKERKIERIVVFYTDQTFKEYDPAK